MRILMIAPEPIFEPRGTPLSVVGRLKALSDLGHAVDLLTYSIGEDVSFPNLRLFRIPKVPGIRKIKIGPSIPKIPLDVLLFIKTLVRLVQNRYDVIHTHEEAGFWGALLSRCFGVPHLYDMHSSLPQQLENFQFSRSRLLIGLFRILEERILQSAQGVIAISPELYLYAQSVHAHPNLKLIENVVDYGMVFGETDIFLEIQKRYRLEGKRVIGYTGTFEPYQGLELLIECADSVLRHIRQTVFLLVGGHPDQIAFYRRMAQKRGLEHAFVFTGQVQPQDVNSYIRCADVLVSPRIAGNNTPLKIYAYLRSGIPVVATRLVTHTQVLNEHVSVLTDANPESFARGIVAVLSNKRLSNILSRNAANLAEKAYGYPVYLEKLSDVVQKTVNRRTF